MKILEKQSAILSNEEVLLHVKQIRAENEDNKDFTLTKTEIKGDGSKIERPGGKLRDLKLVCDDVVDFFAGQDSPLQKEAKQEVTACQGPYWARKTEGQEEAIHERMADLSKKLKKFGLTKAESLMIVNHRPKNESVLEVLVEESESRFPPELQQQQEILKIIGDAFGIEGEEE